MKLFMFIYITQTIQFRVDQLITVYLRMFETIEPPSEKIRLHIAVQKLLGFVCLVQTMFLMFHRKVDAVSYFMSAVIYFLSWRRLSYFGCIINQVFNLMMIWNLLLEMANQLQNGLYEIYLSAQVLYKMASLIFNIVCIYFNFSTYQVFKQLAYEIYQYQVEDVGHEGDGKINVSG